MTDLSRDQLLNVPRPQLQRQRQQSSCNKSTLRQQSSGDTGLGSSLELSPTNTPSPNPPVFNTSSNRHTSNNHNNHNHNNRKQYRNNREDFDEAENYELSTIYSQTQNTVHSNRLPHPSLVVKVQRPTQDQQSVDFSYAGQYYADDTEIELPVSDFYTLYSPHEDLNPYPNTDRYQQNHNSQYYYSEENEYEHNRLLYNHNHKQNRHQDCYDPQIAHVALVQQTPTPNSSQKSTPHKNHIPNFSNTRLKLSRESIEMPRAPQPEKLPISSISEDFDRSPNDNSFGNTAFAYDAQSSPSHHNRVRRLPRSAGVPEDAEQEDVTDLKEHQPNHHRRSSPRKGSGPNSQLPNSAWWKWSQQRRVSAKQSEEELLNQLPVERVSTPVMKAREESLHLGGSINAGGEQRRMPVKKQVSKNAKGKKGKGKNRKNSIKEMELTMSQWNRLIAYWEHKTFVQARYASLVFFFLALVLGTVSVSVNAWSFHRLDNSTAWTGLWNTCFIANSSCVSTFEYYGGGNWQKAVIGLVIFSLAFAFMGSVLAMLGLCITYLPRKMYYYHSAGEVFFVSALATTMALAVYPYAVQKMLFQSHQFGYGYALGWAAAVLLYLSAFTMMMDDLVRESARPRPCQSLCCCCKGRSSSNSQSSYPQPV